MSQILEYQVNITFYCGSELYRLGIRELLCLGCLTLLTLYHLPREGTR
jgi:hypothetical protein